MSVAMKFFYVVVICIIQINCKAIVQSFLMQAAYGNDSYAELILKLLSIATIYD